MQTQCKLLRMFNCQLPKCTTDVPVTECISSKDIESVNSSDRVSLQTMSFQLIVSLLWPFIFIIQNLKVNFLFCSIKGTSQTSFVLGNPRSQLLHIQGKTKSFAVRSSKPWKTETLFTGIERTFKLKQITYSKLFLLV